LISFSQDFNLIWIQNWFLSILKCITCILKHRIFKWTLIFFRITTVKHWFILTRIHFNKSDTFIILNFRYVFGLWNLVYKSFEMFHKLRIICCDLLIKLLNLSLSLLFFNFILFNLLLSSTKYFFNLIAAFLCVLISIFFTKVFLNCTWCVHRSLNWTLYKSDCTCNWLRNNTNYTWS